MLSEDKEKQLDEKLKELAKKNFDWFCTITNADKIQAYVCIERQRGKSYAQIAMVLDMKRESVFSRAKKCKCD